MGLIWIDNDHRQHGRTWTCFKLTVEGHKLSQRYKLPPEYLTRLKPVVIPPIYSRKIKLGRGRSEIALGRRFGVTPDGFRNFKD